MSRANIEVTQLKELLLAGVPFVDVRAPVEFQQGHLPGAVNLPILSDEERALIGTIYKQRGQAEAVAKGFELVSGDVKDARVEAWKSFLTSHPEAVLYCFRGGKRSQITQQWLREAGVDRPLIVGGYKKSRQFLLDELGRISNESEMLILSGPTGSGKTQLIKSIQSFYPALDLEGLARHRGSAFGSMDVPQPSQVNFENLLAVQFLRREQDFSPILSTLIEDESRLIGRISIPEGFFSRMRASKVLWLDEPLATRVENIYRDYILETAIGRSTESIPRCAEELEILRTEALKVFARYKNSLSAIQRKLGGLRTQEVMSDLEAAETAFLNSQNIESNKVWIEKLLVYYYDPLYLGSLERRQVQIAFKGSSAEAVAFLKSLTS